MFWLAMVAVSALVGGGVYLLFRGPRMHSSALAQAAKELGLSRKSGYSGVIDGVPVSVEALTNGRVRITTPLPEPPRILDLNELEKLWELHGRARMLGLPRRGPPQRVIHTFGEAGVIVADVRAAVAERKARWGVCSGREFVEDIVFGSGPAPYRVAVAELLVRLYRGTSHSRTLADRLEQADLHAIRLRATGLCGKARSLEIIEAQIADSDIHPADLLAAYEALVSLRPDAQERLQANLRAWRSSSKAARYRAEVWAAVDLGAACALEHIDAVLESPSRDELGRLVDYAVNSEAIELLRRLCWLRNLGWQGFARAYAGLRPHLSPDELRAFMERWSKTERAHFNDAIRQLLREQHPLALVYTPQLVKWLDSDELVLLSRQLARYADSTAVSLVARLFAHWDGGVRRAAAANLRYRVV